MVKEIREIIEISKNDREDTGRRLSPEEKRALIARLTKEMRNAAELLEFEYAAELRDRIEQLKRQK